MVRKWVLRVSHVYFYRKKPPWYFLTLSFNLSITVCRAYSLSILKSHLNCLTNSWNRTEYFKAILTNSLHVLHDYNLWGYFVAHWPRDREVTCSNPWEFPNTATMALKGQRGKQMGQAPPNFVYWNPNKRIYQGGYHLKTPNNLNNARVCLCDLNYLKLFVRQIYNG